MRRILLALLLVATQAVAQPTPGTVLARQAGTWTVQPGNTANTTPWLTTIQQGGNAATVSAGGALKVDASASTQPVSGTVTANAGTNLNTSALALEAGNLATIAGSITSARQAVNVISGQTGVQGASGAVSASTQRVVLATDVALPAGTNGIGKLTANSGVDIGDVTIDNVAGTNPVPIEGNLAHNTAVGSTKPVLVGFDGRTSLPSAVTAGTVVRPIADTLGRGVFTFYAPLGDQAHFSSTNTSTVAAVQIRSAQGAGLRNTIVQVLLTNRSATPTAVIISDGSMSKILFAPANSMTVVNNPIPWRFGDNLAVTATTLVSVDKVIVDCLMITSII